MRAMRFVPEAPRARANVEIKARCEDLDDARKRALRLAPERVGLDHQVDTYFRTRTGRLKLRESSLSGGQLVPYLRPDEAGPRRSEYRVIPVDDPAGVKRLFTEVLGVECVVEKEREILIHENVRIHLDRVKGLGTFLELEAVFDGSPDAEAEQHRKVAFLIKELGVQEKDLLAQSYEQLVRES
jgi:predicted adenylyl cyclase CyaB